VSLEAISKIIGGDRKARFQGLKPHFLLSFTAGFPRLRSGQVQPCPSESAAQNKKIK
jgi:hypothetical protein